MKTILILALVLIAVVACAKKMTSGDVAYSNVNVEEFQTLIAQDDVQLVDVRRADEFADGHIARALNIDVSGSDFVNQALNTLDKKRPVAVYCRSGRRSANAASQLTAQGFKVTNLKGGIMAWNGAGKPVEK